jgi:hypothetical protein
LRTDARLYADQRPGGSQVFINDTELTRLVNLKARELRDKLVDARGSAYYATEATIAIVGGTSRYDLPISFYELDSVTLEWSDQDHELMFPVGSTRLRVAYESTWHKWSRYDSKAYRLRSSQIEFLPAPTSDVTCRIQYVPVFADLVNDADTFDGINGWEKMLTLGVAIEMMAIDKRTNATLVQQYGEQLARIEEMKTERDAEAPKEIVDVHRLRGRRGWYGSVYDNTFDPTFG